MCAHHLVLRFWRLLVGVTDRKQAKSLFLCCKEQEIGWQRGVDTSLKFFHRLRWHDGSKSLKIEWPRGRFTFQRESFEKDSLTQRESDLPSSGKNTRAVSRKCSLIWIALHWETSDALFVHFSSCLLYLYGETYITPRHCWNVGGKVSKYVLWLCNRSRVIANFLLLSCGQHERYCTFSGFFWKRR